MKRTLATVLCSLAVSACHDGASAPAGSSDSQDTAKTCHSKPIDAVVFKAQQFLGACAFGDVSSLSWESGPRELSADEIQQVIELRARLDVPENEDPKNELAVERVNGSLSEFHFNTEEQPCAGKAKTLLDLGFDQTEGVVVQNEFEEQVVLYGLQITADDGNSYRVYFHQAFGT